MSTAILWLRRDLRLADNPALHAALAAHTRVLPLYVHAPEEEAPWQPGAASRWWLHHSLAALDAELRARGAALHIARGPSLAALLRLIDGSGAAAVYWNRQYEPAALARDRGIKAALRARGIAAHSSNAALLLEPWQAATGEGAPYRVFTPFWRAAGARLQPVDPLPAPARIAAGAVPGALALADLGLLPRVRWDAGMRDAWRPGEAGAQGLLDDFLDAGVGAYPAQRDVPAVAGTSRLSPHLHFGEIGPRQILARLCAHAGGLGASLAHAGSGHFLRELGWREFSHHLLYHFPHTAQHNFNAAFDAFPWREPDRETLRRWQRGRTGIPIVDAGMRELWHTGWMHNRVRMIVASLLTKNLRAHWLHGARWFWDTLVDADLANNTLGWQWSAGCGADAAPYFRIFSPAAQSARFDAAGAYIRRWVPELRAAAPPLLIEPWRDAALLARSGYPPPIVDPAASRGDALAAYRQLRAGRGR